MKSRLFIIAFLILSLMSAFAVIANGQCINGNVAIISSADSTLIGDETWVTYLKTEAKIICNNETVFNKIFLSHSQLFKRFTCTWKHNKKVAYKQYIVYIDKTDSNILISWAKNNL